jgi:hypothetical protein
MAFVVRGFIPDGLRSRPWLFGAAARPVGDKSPHHRVFPKHEFVARPSVDHSVKKTRKTSNISAH